MCKSVRPVAQLGFYGCPEQKVYGDRSTGGGGQGMDDSLTTQKIVSPSTRNILSFSIMNYPDLNIILSYIWSFLGTNSCC